MEESSDDTLLIRRLQRVESKDVFGTLVRSADVGELSGRYAAPMSPGESHVTVEVGENTN